MQLYEGHSELCKCDTLRLTISLPYADGSPSQFERPRVLRGEELRRLAPTEESFARAIAELKAFGLEVTGRGKHLITARCTPQHYEDVFKTKLAARQLFEAGELAGQGDDLLPLAQFGEVFENAERGRRAPVARPLESIESAIIEPPIMYHNNRFDGENSALAPGVSYHTLRLPGDVAMLLNAVRLHRNGVTGKGVRVAMIDSGFAHGHSFFKEHMYKSSVVSPNNAGKLDKDEVGHGTAMSACLFAVAPDVELIGVKVDDVNEASYKASLIEGLDEARRHDPHIISISLMSEDLRKGGDVGSLTHRKKLPEGFMERAETFQRCVDDGITVIVSAGNGEVAFPGMLPDVISVGGVHVKRNGEMQASDYASSYTTRLVEFPGRHVPDLSGLVGMASPAGRAGQYIMMPTAVNSRLDGRNGDGTGRADAWAAASGTSAAAPQIAGVAALMLQEQPGLSPAEIKSVLMKTARKVVNGAGNPFSNEGTPLLAAEPKGATGAGLANANAAIESLRS